MQLKTNLPISHKSMVSIQHYIDEIYQLGWSDASVYLMNKKQ